MIAPVLNKSIAYTTPLNRHAVNYTQDPAFKGIKTKLIICAPIAYYLAIGYEYLPADNYKPKITSYVEWQDSTKILASGSQRYYTYGFDYPSMYQYQTNINGFYSNELIAKLKHGEASSISEAHKLLEKGGLKERTKLSNGYKLIYSQHPVATPHDVDAWNIDDKDKNRIILAIGGSEYRYTKSINGFSDKISDIFSVPEKNIIKVPDADIDTVKEGLKKLAKKVKISDPENTEVLIYYNGHGYTDSNLDSDNYIPYFDHFIPEGQAKGRTEVGLTEEDLKDFVNKEFKDIKTLIIMDTCFAGAWIAENEAHEAKTKDGKPLYYYFPETEPLANRKKTIVTA